jgi:ribonuclease Z
MNPSFHVRSLNGPFGDPGLYVRVIREGRAFLFDLGFTTSLSTRDILKISDIFISHAHIDHFIGFDNVLRFHLKKETPLRLYGPKGFIDHIEGRLRGYTWNLIKDYPLVIEAYEIDDKDIKRSIFRAQDHFKREEDTVRPFDGLIKREPPFMIRAAVLDHQIPCLAFSLEEDFHINIDKAELKKMGLPVGPWLRELKIAIREGKRDCSFVIDGNTYSLSEVKDIAKITKGQKLSYVVDVLGSEENIERIVKLVRGSGVLYIETYFLDRDRERARERYHLTAKEAGMIAGVAGVTRLEPIHISPKYIDHPDEVIEEVMKEFRKYQG